MKKSHEEIEAEQFIRMQAEQARGWQQTITADEDLERWVNEGNLSFLQRRVFDDIEREAFQTIKNPSFDPSNLSQVAQLKALCQVIDLLNAKIMNRIQRVQDARSKLHDLEHSTQTQKEGE